MIVARALGPSGFGDFTVFFSLMVVVTGIGDFIDITYVRHVNAPGGRDRRAYLRGALLLRTGLFALLALLAWPLGVLLADEVFGRSELRLAVVTALLAGAALGLVQLLASTFLARRALGRYAATTSLFYAVVVLVLLPVHLADLSLEPDTVYAIFLGTAAAIGAGSAAVLVRGARPLRFERGPVGEIATYAKWLFAAGLVQALYQRLDVVVLARYVPQAEVGHYGAAIRYAMIGSMMLAAMMGFLLPRAAASRASRAALASYLREAALLTVLLLVGIFVLFLAAPEAVVRLFGPEYEDAVGLARILLFGTAIAVVSLPFGQLLLAEDEPREILYLGLVRLAVIVTLALTLIPRLGAEGAAWATVAAEGLALVYAVALFARKWPSRLREMPAGTPTDA